VELNITILQEGPHGKVGDIEITGLKRNRREDVLKYLDLKPGVKFDRALLAKLEKRLWDSARFKAFKITPEDQTNGGVEMVKLNIELNEFAPMPPLSEKLSRGGEAMVRLANWLAGPECAREDIVADYHELLTESTVAIHFILSPHGLIVDGTPD